MSVRRILQSILVVSLSGAAFSGVLTYLELFTATSEASCPAPGPAGTILGYPACVYGFFMYLLIVALTVWALRADGRSHT